MLPGVEAAVTTPSTDEDYDFDDETEEPGTVGGWVFELAKTWGPVILAIVIIRLFIFQPFTIPSTSMVPTLLIGDALFVTQFDYGLWFPTSFTEYHRTELIDWGDPKHGDIIVFRYPKNPKIHYIKRVVALAGDTVEVRDNQVILNGVPEKRVLLGRHTYEDDAAGRTCVNPEANIWSERLSGTSHQMLTDDRPSALANHSPTKVPEGSVFVMGDNRDHSGDSRQWGFVDEELIVGKARFIAVSFKGCYGDPSEGIRWERVGQGLGAPISPNVSAASLP